MLVRGAVLHGETSFADMLRIRRRTREKGDIFLVGCIGLCGARKWIGKKLLLVPGLFATRETGC